MRPAPFTDLSVLCGSLARNPSVPENDMSTLMRFWRDEAATTAIEYALIACGISVVIVASVNAIGGNVKNLYTNVSSNLANAGH
jgi:pilus assembly protein Flp/PilA